MTSFKENLILVNEADEAIGTMEKLEAHQKGLLHRAFSVFIFNSKNQLLLHQRNPKKYHSGGLWTNTCCGHPRPEEPTQNAAERRLFEEMGFTVPLQSEFSFIYKAKFSNQLTEYEFDHVFFGSFENEPTPNPDEVSDWKYVDWNNVVNDIDLNPEKYTVWFKICVEKINEKMFQPVLI
jgi:isopentenyl-diphosphate delta-isomerase